jgi:hypothetical protein
MQQQVSCSWSLFSKVPINLWPAPNLLLSGSTLAQHSGICSLSNQHGYKVFSHQHDGSNQASSNQCLLIEPMRTLFILPILGFIFAYSDYLTILKRVTRLYAIHVFIFYLFLQWDVKRGLDYCIYIIYKVVINCKNVSMCVLYVKT